MRAQYTWTTGRETIQVELGEKRVAKRGAIHLCVGEKLEMENLPLPFSESKEERRKARADYIWRQVKNQYETF